MRRRGAMWTGLILAALGLALWTASLWVITYRRAAPEPELTVALLNGELWVTTAGSYFAPGFRAMHASPRAASFPALRWWPHDAWFERYTLGARANQWSLRVPLWSPVALGLGLAGGAAALRRVERRRRERAGRCGACGYDCRGLDGVCPECGRPISRLPAP